MVVIEDLTLPLMNTDYYLSNDVSLCYALYSAPNYFLCARLEYVTHRVGWIDRDNTVYSASQ